MSIEPIDSDLCNGCGICVDDCWMDVIRMDETEEKAIAKYPEDCIGIRCAVCEMDCPQHAIYVSPTKQASPITCWGL